MFSLLLIFILLSHAVSQIENNELWFYVNVLNGKSISNSGNPWIISDPANANSIVIHNIASKRYYCGDIIWDSNGIKGLVASFQSLPLAPDVSDQYAIIANALIHTQTLLSGAFVSIEESEYTSSFIDTKLLNIPCNSVNVSEITGGIDLFIIKTDSSGIGKSSTAIKNDQFFKLVKSVVVIKEGGNSFCCDFSSHLVSPSSISCSNFTLIGTTLPSSSELIANVNLFSGEGTFASLDVLNLIDTTTAKSQSASFMAHVHSQKCENQQGGPHYQYVPAVTPSTSAAQKIQTSDNKFILEWTVTGDVVTFIANVICSGWLAVGFNQLEEMPGADVVIGGVDLNNAGYVLDAKNKGYSAVVDPNQNVNFLSANHQPSNITTNLQFSRKINTGDPNDIDLSQAKYVLLAFNSVENGNLDPTTNVWTFNKHSDEYVFPFSLLDAGITTTTTIATATILPPVISPENCVDFSNTPANSFVIDFSSCPSPGQVKVKTCAEPDTGFFVSELCKKGSSSANGSDTVTTPCSTDIPSKTFVLQTCESGTSLTKGLNLATQLISKNIPDNAFIAEFAKIGSVNSRGSDYTFEECTVPEDQEYVVSECLSGSMIPSDELGVDTVIDFCNYSDMYPRKPDHYVTAICVQGSPTQKGTNTAILPCSSAPEGWFVSKVCSPGFYNELGSPSVFKENPLTTTLNAPVTTKKPSEDSIVSPNNFDTYFQITFVFIILSMIGFVIYYKRKNARGDGKSGNNKNKPPNERNPNHSYERVPLTSSKREDADIDLEVTDGWGDGGAEEEWDAWDDNKAAVEMAPLMKNTANAAHIIQSYPTLPKSQIQVDLPISSTNSSSNPFSHSSYGNEMLTEVSINLNDNPPVHDDFALNLFSPTFPTYDNNVVNNNTLKTNSVVAKEEKKKINKSEDLFSSLGMTPEFKKATVISKKADNSF